MGNAVTIAITRDGRPRHAFPQTLNCKILALAFVLMIGFVLVADGLGVHVPKGHVYFAMAFSVLNLRLRRRGTR